MGNRAENGISAAWLMAPALLAALFLWRSPLGASLWTDELVSAWIISGNLKQAVDRALEYQGQSPLYFSLLWLHSAVAGSSELALRLPSLLAWVCCLLLFYRLARELLGVETAAFGLIGFVALDGLQVAALSARPYAFALLSVLASVWFLQRWCSGGKRQDLALAVVSCALAFYFHYLFGLSIIVLGWYFLFCRDSRVVNLPTGCVALVLLALFCLPGAFHLQALSQRVGQLSFAGRPLVADLIEALFPLYLNVSILTAVFAGAAFYGARIDISRIVKRQRAVKLIAVWALSGPVLFFIASYLGRESLFVSRYFLWSTPASALLCALIPALLAEVRARRAALVIFCVMLCAREASKQWHVEQWREAIALAAESAANGPTKVLFNPGLVESADAQWLRDPKQREYLLAAFSYYPLAADKVLLPIGMNRDEFTSYLDDVLPSGLNAADLWLLCPARKVRHPETGELVLMELYYEYLLERFGYIPADRNDSGLRSKHPSGVTSRRLLLEGKSQVNE